MSIKELMKECEFAQEMKDHILTNKKEVIGHYFYVQNLLMVTKKEYLKKRPPFYICKIKVSRTIQNLRSKSSLPTIGQRSVENKLKNLITDYAKANTKQDGIPKFELVNSTFAHASFFIKTPFGQYEKISCSCAPSYRIPSSGKIGCYQGLINVYCLPIELEFLRDQRGCRKMSLGQRDWLGTARY